VVQYPILFQRVRQHDQSKSVPEHSVASLLCLSVHVFSVIISRDFVFRQLVIEAAWLSFPDDS
jgi:hypothetical protein